MRKTVLAPACLALAAAAHAQSSVTIYGIVDQGLNKMNPSTSTAVNPGAGTNGTLVVRAAWQNRLGFRGEEDLGGGLAAWFHLEHRFSADDGNAVVPFWAGRSVVGARSRAWGEAWLGRDYLPAFWVAVALDPWNWNTVGQMGSLYTMARYTGAEQLPRNNNTINYKSPSFGGVTMQLMHRVGEGSATVGKSTGANLVYSKGPVFAGVAFDRAQNTNPAGPDAQMLMAGGAYDFGFIRPRVSFARSKPFTGPEVRSYMIGATAPVGSGRVLAGWARLRPDGPNNDATKFGLGYHYDLSKRTMLYADVGTARLQGGTRSTGFDLGVRHTF